jgi:hypothetical protein
MQDLHVVLCVWHEEGPCMHADTRIALLMLWFASVLCLSRCLCMYGVRDSYHKDFGCMAFTDWDPSPTVYDDPTILSKSYMVAQRRLATSTSSVLWHHSMHCFISVIWWNEYAGGVPPNCGRGVPLFYCAISRTALAYCITSFPSYRCDCLAVWCRSSQRMNSVH